MTSLALRMCWHTWNCTALLSQSGAWAAFSLALEESRTLLSAKDLSGDSTVMKGQILALCYLDLGRSLLHYISDDLIQWKYRVFGLFLYSRQRWPVNHGTEPLTVRLCKQKQPCTERNESLKATQIKLSVVFCCEWEISKIVYVCNMQTFPCTHNCK